MEALDMIALASSRNNGLGVILTKYLSFFALF